MFRSRRSGPGGPDTGVDSPQDNQASMIWSPVEMQPTSYSTPFGQGDSPRRRTSFGSRFRRRSAMGHVAGVSGVPDLGTVRSRLSSAAVEENSREGMASSSGAEADRPPSAEPPPDGAKPLPQITPGAFPPEYAKKLGLFYYDNKRRYVPRFNLFVKPAISKKPVDSDDVLEVTRKYLDTRPLPKKKLPEHSDPSTSSSEVGSESETSTDSEDASEGVEDEAMDSEISPTAIIGMKLSEESIMQRFRHAVSEGIIPHFRIMIDHWKAEKKQGSSFPTVKAFARMITDTHTIIKAWMMPDSVDGEYPRLHDLPRDTVRFDEKTYTMICAELQGILHSQFADVCPEFMAELYSYGFYAHDWHIARPNEREGILPSPPFISQCIADLDGPDCWCGSCVFEDFMLINLFLRELQLTECFAGEHVYKLLRKKIFSHVKENLLRAHDVRQVDSLISWMTGSVMHWIDSIYAPHVPAYRDGKIWDLLELEARQRLRQETDDRRKLILAQLSEYLFKCVAKILIKSIFNIIVEYPESQPSLEDLRTCLENLEPKIKHEFVVKVRNILCNKLLQPGVLTHDILTGYVSAIKALRFVDPSGVVLLEACIPIRAYLRGRPDTVKRIVVSLTDSRSGELADELANSDANTPGVTAHDWMEEDDMDFGLNSSVDHMASAARGDGPTDLEEWELWEPEKWDVRPEHGNRAIRQADIITMLVNIYGSRKVFMQEYMKILAARILEDATFDLEREIRCKEFLKLRFGETYLHNCEVMLKDVQESQRMNHLVSSDDSTTSKPFDVKALIRSVQFWPEMPLGETIALPETVMKELDQYRSAFEVMKGSRTLVWDTQLGEVKIKVELGDRVLDMSVRPIMACIIMRFSEKSTWTLSELSEKLRVAPAYLKRKLRFWQARKVLREVQPDQYVQFETVAEWQDADRQCFASIPTIAYYDNDDEVERECAADVGGSKLDAYWSYIVGMLTNIKTLPLNRIHSMLRMFAMQNASVEECSIDELRAYLHEKVCNQQLLYISGMFRLPSSQ